MKTWQDLKTEQNTIVSEKNFNRIKELSALMKVWRNSKNCVLDEMEVTTELRKLLRSPGENPCKTMNNWLMNEL